MHFFAFCFVWVWNLVVDIAGAKEDEGFWEHGVKGNILKTHFTSIWTILSFNLLVFYAFFACCFVWVWNFVVDIAGGKEDEGFWEHGVEGNIWKPHFTSIWTIYFFNLLKFYAFFACCFVWVWNLVVDIAGG